MSRSRRLSAPSAAASAPSALWGFGCGAAAVSTSDPPESARHRTAETHSCHSTLISTWACGTPTALCGRVRGLLADQRPEAPEVAAPAVAGAGDDAVVDGAVVDGEVVRVVDPLVAD